MTAQIDLLTPILDSHFSKWSASLDVLRAHLRDLSRLQNRPVSSDDAHDYLDRHNISVCKDRRWLGALFRHQGFRPAGYQNSRRVEQNHGRPVMHWWPV